MDQFDAFQYFLTSLWLHNLVLVVAAGVLGLVLGRLMFGTSKAVLEKLREALKTEEVRAASAERELEKLRAGRMELLAKLEEGGPVDSPEHEKELTSLRVENQALKRRVNEVEEAVAELEKRIGKTIEEREQVEKASAVLRKEMRGLRNKMKEVEAHESLAGGLELALKETEERLTRSQATVAKESRVKAGLEKRVEDLEQKLEEANAERGRRQEEVAVGREMPLAAASGGGEAAAGTEAEAGASEPSGGVETAAGESRTAEPEPDPPREEAQGEEAQGEAGEDLTRIKGIGAVLARKLHAQGVTTFRQVADWTDEDLKEFSRKLRLGNRAERGDWRGQARALCGGD